MTKRRFALTLAALVSVAAVLRIIACVRGGQYFFGDEMRYERGQLLYLALCRGDFAYARQAIALPEHAVFVWIGLVVTTVQRLLTAPTHLGDWSAHPENVGFSVSVAASLLSLFSTASILLVALIARELGADREESLWAALLLAASNTAFYYARSLLPYDASVCVALGGLWLGLRPPSPTRALWAGVVIGLSYQVYNGHWFLTPVLAAAVLAQWRSRPDRGRLAVRLLGGVALGVGVPLLIGTWAGGQRYWQILVHFSGTVKFGLFAEGWSFPWEYLWYSERGLGLAVALVILGAILQARRSGQPLEARARTWLAILGSIYVLLVLCSVFLHVFVVYGRTVKALVPFLCLAGAWGLHRLLAGRRWLKLVAAASTAMCGALMVAPHLTFVFPLDIEISVLRKFGNPKHAVSVSGSLFDPLQLPVVRPDLALVNAQLLYPVRAFIGFPAGKVLERFDNVLTYRPFQYEGHTPKQRALLRTSDISIELIQLANPAEVPDQVPNEFRNHILPNGKEL